MLAMSSCGGVGDLSLQQLSLKLGRHGSIKLKNRRSFEARAERRWPGLHKTGVLDAR